jgi:hypothetical protein
VGYTHGGCGGPKTCAIAGADEPTDERPTEADGEELADDATLGFGAASVDRSHAVTAPSANAHAHTAGANRATTMTLRVVSYSPAGMASAIGAAVGRLASRTV